MKCFSLFVLLAVFFGFNAFAEDSLKLADNTKSVLKTEATSPQVTNVETGSKAVATAPSCENSPSLTYSGKQNIAPCATQKSACLSYCEKGCDACCNTTFKSVGVEVPICVPPCPSKETVTRSRSGKRAVYDYGRYEVVLRANDEGDISVKYRKRILDR